MTARHFLTNKVLRGMMTGIALLALGVLAIEQAPAGRVLNDALVTHPFGHHVWQEVLMQNVGPDGAVDFAHLRAYPRRLNEYLGQLDSASPENDPKAFPTREDQTAYWINAQNAIALRLILNRYPVSSITDVNELETSKHYKLGGRRYNLPQIRAKAIASSPGLPILFTLTDFSLSAPPIAARAYEGKALKVLSLQARKNTLASPDLIQFQRLPNGCVVTRISPFFKSLEAALFTPSIANEEDQDALSETQATLDDRPMRWPDLLRAWAPPSLYADLGKPCSQTVEPLPAQPTLRQLQLLRS